MSARSKVRGGIRLTLLGRDSGVVMGALRANFVVVLGERERDSVRS